jgi:hypothetical protein
MGQITIRGSENTYVDLDCLRSPYALKLALGEKTDRVPFFVVPPKGTATARIALVVPSRIDASCAGSTGLSDASAVSITWSTTIALWSC